MFCRCSLPFLRIHEYARPGRRIVERRSDRDDGVPYGTYVDGSRTRRHHRIHQRRCVRVIDHMFLLAQWSSCSCFSITHVRASFQVVVILANIFWPRAVDDLAPQDENTFRKVTDQRCDECGYKRAYYRTAQVCHWTRISSYSIIHTYTFAHLTSTHARTYINTHVHNMHLHTYAWTHTPTYLHTHEHASKGTHIGTAQVCRWTRISSYENVWWAYTDTHIYNPCFFSQGQQSRCLWAARKHSPEYFARCRCAARTKVQLPFSSAWSANTSGVSQAKSFRQLHMKEEEKSGNILRTRHGEFVLVSIVLICEIWFQSRPRSRRGLYLVNCVFQCSAVRESMIAIMQCTTLNGVRSVCGICSPFYKFETLATKQHWNLHCGNDARPDFPLPNIRLHIFFMDTVFFFLESMP